MPDYRSLPHTYQSVYLRAQDMIAQGNHDEAIESLSRIVERLSSLSDRTLSRRQDLAGLAVEAGWQLSSLLQYERRYEEAVSTLRKLQKFSPERQDEFDRQAALVLAEKGDLAAALQLLSDLTARFPYDPAHWLALGSVEFSHDQLKQAEEHFRKALELTSDDQLKGHAAFLLCRLYVAQGDKDKLVETYDNFYQVDPDAPDLWVREFYSFLLRSNELALLRRYLSQDSSPLRVEFYRGLVAQREGDFVEGRQHWDRLLQMNPLEHGSGHLEWAEAALRTNQPQRALTLLAVLPRSHSYPFLSLLRAIASAQIGNLSAAGDHLEFGTRLLLRDTPRKTLYTSADWEMLVSLVDDPEAREQLRRYFAVVETV